MSTYVAYHDHTGAETCNVVPKSTSDTRPYGRKRSGRYCELTYVMRVRYFYSCRICSPGFSNISETKYFASKVPSTCLLTNRATRGCDVRARISASLNLQLGQTTKNYLISKTKKKQQKKIPRQFTFTLAPSFIVYVFHNIL